MKTRTELNLGKVFYVWLIYHIQDFWLNLLNGYDIYFWLRETANQPLIHLKRIYSLKKREQNVAFQKLDYEKSTLFFREAAWPSG